MSPPPRRTASPPTTNQEDVNNEKSDTVSERLGTVVIRILQRAAAAG